MKRYQTITTLCCVLAAAALPSISRAKDKPYETTVITPSGVAAVEPGEEARKIRRLAKIALANGAPESSHQVLSDEIAVVEKNKKLKAKVIQFLLQDDDPDPTLPSVDLVKYPDGKVRGLLFTQRDNVHGTANRLAWPLDPKREEKEKGR